MKDKIIFISVAVVAVVIGVLVFLFGQSGTQSTSADYNSAMATAVPFVKVTQGTHSSVTTRTDYLITSSAQLSELWNMVDATSTPPAVDFTKQAVLAVFAGAAPDASITVANITDTNERMVSIVVAKPSSACKTPVPAISPYEIVVVPMTLLPLTHEDVASTTSCPR